MNLQFLENLDTSQLRDYLTRSHLLSRELDERIEQAQSGFQNIDKVLGELVGIARRLLNVQGAFLLARGHDLNLHSWCHGIDEADLIDVIHFAEHGFAGETPEIAGMDLEILDLFGRRIGLFGWIVPASSAPDAALITRQLAEIFCEQIDNYIFSENCSRDTHAMKIRIGDMLKNRLFAKGLIDAVNVLQESIDFNALILIYHDENDATLESLKYFIYSEEKGFFDPYHHFDRETHTFIQQHARKILDGNDPALLKRFSVVNYQEDFLISGIKDAVTIGKLIVSSGTSSFDVLEKEILQVFVSFIQQRVLDFNKEWRNLSETFSVTQRLRLLEHEGYEHRFLKPLVQEVAILFADISSFTFFCEQVLIEPQLITELFDTWASQIMALIWQNGGCCDKFVGDCVIAHFGPPFYDTAPEENCRNALACAVAIRNYTQSLLNRPEACYRAIAASNSASKFGVATGLNFGRVNIGVIGPNRDFTAFGSDMNNTARIQGQAKCNEILLLKSCASFVAEQCTLEGPFHAEMKNVKDKAEYFKFVEWKK